MTCITHKQKITYPYYLSVRELPPKNDTVHPIQTHSTDPNAAQHLLGENQKRNKTDKTHAVNAEKSLQLQSKAG